VPLSIDALVDESDFEQVDVRVLDTVTGAKLATLTLKNALV